jgi:hypothetical protein
VISSAQYLLTCRDLHRFVSLCNDGYDAVQGEYYIYEHWQSLLLDAPPTFGSGMGLRDTRRTKRATTKAGVVARIPKVDASTSLHITSGLHTSSGYNSILKRHLGTNNLRYVHMQLFFIASCLLLANKKCV